MPAARASDDRSNDLVSITCKEERLGVAVKQATGGVCLVSANALSDREAVLLAQGRTDTIEAALRMFLSPHTVQNHLKSIFTKTGTHNRRRPAVTRPRRPRRVSPRPGGSTTALPIDSLRATSAATGTLTHQ